MGTSMGRHGASFIANFPFRAAGRSTDLALILAPSSPKVSRLPDPKSRKMEMAQKAKDTPEEILKFFAQLDPGGAVEEECQMHYGCSCVIRKGHHAARILMEVQRTLSGKSAPAAEPQPIQQPADDEGLGEELRLAQKEVDRLFVQNLELAGENKSLKEKIGTLQKQIERLYNRNEMMSTLSKIENKKLSMAERAAEPASPDSAEAESSDSLTNPEIKAQEPQPPKDPESKPEPPPAPSPAPQSTNKELQDELAFEAAVRVPREEVEAEKAKAQESGSGGSDEPKTKN
jgi:hypothetical protein